MANELFGVNQLGPSNNFYEHRNGPSEKISASGVFKTMDGKTIEIRDVWASNLDTEMEIIRDLLEKYKYVAMDTEFPGVVARPVGDVNDMHYQTLRCNVDMLKLIQLGITLTDEHGNFVDGCTCWQFNFKFSLKDDIFAQDSIELLKTSGIDFEKFEKYGIDIQYFGELIMMSGLVLSDDIKWISFHSKYDFGYLLKTLTCTELPLDEVGFMELLGVYFPCVYDIKYMMTATEGMHGGLNSLAEALQIDRIGPMHQAGSDSLLTAQVFFGLVKKHFNNICDDSRFKGELFGVGTNHTKYKTKYTPPTNNITNNNLNNNDSNNSNHGNIVMNGQYPQLQFSSSAHYPAHDYRHITSANIPIFPPMI